MTSAIDQQSEYREIDGLVAEVVRTQRKKTVDIRVVEGMVSIVVPTDLDGPKIDSLLKQKKHWIIRKVAFHNEQQPIKDKSFVSGECLPYLGRNYRLKVVDAPFAPAKLANGFLVVSVPEANRQEHIIRNAVVRWYQRLAIQKLQEKVEL